MSYQVLANTILLDSLVYSQALEVCLGERLSEILRFGTVSLKDWQSRL